MAPRRSKKIPQLPALRELLPHSHYAEWHPMTLRWWRDVWTSPMASQYLPADEDGLCRVAVIVDKYWRSPKRELLSEIRLQLGEYGQTPLARRRLQWAIKQVEEKKPRRSAARPNRKTDPRQVLRVLK
jgi:hypothetical protein